MELINKYYSDNFSTFIEWYELVQKDNAVYPRFRIPYDEWVQEYIQNIECQSETKVKDLLRYLLVPFTREIDIDKAQLLSEDSDFSIEVYKRLKANQEAWEGLTWILQYLPYKPFRAINALNVYLNAEIEYMPDDRIIGINQCIAIMEAKFIYTNVGDGNLILKLTSREFEWLIEFLYRNLGYETQLTPVTRDGGKDIIANCKREEGVEKVYIECKLYKTTELTKQAVEAFGYNIIKNNINRGIVFCTGYVNDKIKMMDTRIQIWNLAEIIVLLNAHIGADWPTRLTKLIEEQRRYHRK